MTVKEALRGINSYPIPEKALVGIAEKYSLNLDNEATYEILNNKSYNLVYAEILMWLSMAPNITQGGQTYSFSEDQRIQLRAQAKDIMDMYEQPRKTIFGYKGSRL